MSTLQLDVVDISIFAQSPRRGMKNLMENFSWEEKVKSNPPRGEIPTPHLFFRILGMGCSLGSPRLSIERLPFARSKSKPRYAPSLLSTGSETWVDFDKRSLNGMFIGSRQIIATSNDLTPNGGLVREFPQNPINSCLGIIVLCPDWVNQTIQNSMVILSDSPIMHWLSWCHIK